MKIDFSPKQKEVWRNTINRHHRWNISYGAVRSGKTYLDYFKIPYRIRNAGHDGLILLLGNTKGTLERNILDPLRELWTPLLVGHVGSNNKVQLFGRECYALGADKINQVSKLQGAGLVYCYGDEITTWHEDVFNMLKSRLDKPGACFDGTCNPDNPNHWFRKFLDSDADIYSMAFTIDDNPFLSPKFVENLKREYFGSVYYERYIRGLWVAAEGLIYQLFADDPRKYAIDTVSSILEINVGVDFGGSASAHAFVATAITRGYNNVIVLASEKHGSKTNVLDPERLGSVFVEFCKRIYAQYGYITRVYCDSAEQTLIAGLRVSARKGGLPGLRIENALKTTINDRIRLIIRLMAQGRFFYVKDQCNTLVDALSTARWNPKNLTEDERLDDGTSDIDTLDALEYTVERSISQLIRYE